VMGDVVDGLCMNHFVFIAPRLDDWGCVWRRTFEEAIEEDEMLGGIDAGDHGGVIGPSDRGIDGTHSSSVGAFAGDAAKSGARQARIVESVGGKAVKADDNDNRFLVVGRKDCGGGKKKEESGKKTAERADGE